MAELRKIVIEIKQTGGGEQPAPVTPTPVTPVPVTPPNVDNPEKHLLGKSVFLNQAFNIAKESVKQAVETTVSRRLSLKEDYIAENVYRNVKTSVGKAMGFMSTVGAGAMVGGVVGGVIGAVGWGITETINYNQRMSGYYQALNATTMQTQFSSRRAGLYNESRGTEN